MRLKKSLFIFVIVLSAVLFKQNLVEAATNTSLSYSISKESINVGDEFDITVNCYNASDLYGASIDFKYNTSNIEITDIVKGNTFCGFNSFSKITSNNRGQASFIWTMQGNTPGANWYSSNLFVIKAKAIAPGDFVFKTTCDDSIYEKESNSIKIKLSDSSSSKAIYSSEDLKVKVNPLSPLLPGKYEENNNNIKFLGNWQSNNFTQYSNGQLCYSLTPGDSANFSFVGTGFKWLTSTCKSRGIAKVIIDDKTYDVDNYTEGDQFKKVIFEINNLAYGFHNVKIEVTPNKSINASSNCIAIDSLEILDSSNSYLTKGLYEENNQNILFSGLWLDNPYPKYSGGNLKYSITPGNSIVFKFKGTGFRWITSTSSSRGIARITIDNKTYDVDNYSDSDVLNSRIFENNSLPSGNHIAKIEILDNKNPNATSNCIAIDAIEVLDGNSEVIPDNALTTGVFQENNPKITLSGKWMDNPYSGYIGGNLKYSVTPGDTIKFSFKGTGFNWITSTSKSRGIARVNIDGKTYDVDNYSDSDMLKQTIFQINNLSSSVHNVSIQILANKNPNATSNCIAIDAIEVLDENPEVIANNALTPGISQENNPKITLSGKWMDNAYNGYIGGNLKYSVTPGDTIKFSFKGTGFNWITSTSKSRGIARVNIDGKTYDVDNYSDSDMLKRTIFQINNLSSSVHNVSIQILDNKNPNATSNCIAIDAIEVLDENPEVIANNALTPGISQENNPKITLSGKWMDNAYNGYIGGNLKYSVTPGDTIKFSFKGTGFNWITSTSKSRGIARVNIDGKTYDVDNYSDSDMLKRTIFQINNLSSSVHNVSIQILANKNPNATSNCIAIDAIEVLDENPEVIANNALTPGIFQENNPKITLSGKWMDNAYSGYIGGNLKYSVTPGDTIKFSFKGTGFNWITSTSKSRGIARINIDGKTYDVDNYSDSDMLKRTIFQINNLSSSVHNVSIQILANKNPNATSNCIAIDAIEIKE